MKNIFLSNCKKLLRIAPILSLALALISFNANGQTPKESDCRNVSNPIDTATYTLPLPEVPLTLTTPQERAGFVIDHYWDGMDWNETRLLNSERFMGESMATFGMLLGIASQEKAATTVDSLINCLSNKPFALNTLSDYAYSYFYFPGSPQYNEELYMLFVEPLLRQSGIDEGNAVKLKIRRMDILKNRVGTIATDFTFIGTDGRNHSLFETSPKADYRLLMLYDPDCQICDEAVRIIKSSQAFSKAIADGKACVIAINAFGQASKGPALRKPGIPVSWIVGYSPDGTLDTEETYVIRTTPAIYILDRDGRILKKDLSIANLHDFINSTL